MPTKRSRPGHGAEVGTACPEVIGVGYLGSVAVNQHLGPDDGDAANARLAYAALQERVEQAKVELRQLLSDVAEAKNHVGSVEATQLLEANGLVRSAIRSRTDADSAIQALNEVSRSAELDALTGLPNRTRLLDRIAQASASARRRGSRMALLFLDLDNFKLINDSVGHVAGDKVLHLVAARLASSVRAADTVSRYGGDEFVILLSEVSKASDARHIADKMITALGTPCHVGDQLLHLTASVGVSIYPDDGEDAETLIGRADAAMLRSKEQGFGRVAFHGAKPESECSPALSALKPHHSGPLPRERAMDEREHSEPRLRGIGEVNPPQGLAAPSSRDKQDVNCAAAQPHQRFSQLMAVVAHELRNPISPIRTAAALLSRARSEEVPRLQAIIERQVARVSGLISDLLDVSRIEAGKLRLESKVVDIAGVIAEAVDDCKAAIDTRLQHLEVDVPSGRLEVRGDRVRLVQIVSNLLDNASKYTPDGGAIQLSVAVAEDAVRITVADEGIGITAEAMPHIFEPFTQEPHAVGFSGGGLGVGLSVVRELVKAHGGTVVASSCGVGLGSRFVVSLPVACRHAPAGAGGCQADLGVPSEPPD